MSNRTKFSIVLAIIAAVVTVYLFTRRNVTGSQTPLPSGEHSSVATTSTNNPIHSAHDVAGPTSKEMAEGLAKDERDTVTKMSEDVRPLYLTGWYYLRHPSTNPVALEPVIEAVERSLTVNPKNSPKLFENVSAPEHAGFGLAVLAHLWYIKGPIDGLEDRISTQAIRFADCPEDDVVRASAAVMLQVMEERASDRGLSDAAKATLKRLLANDYIRHMAEKQRHDLEEAKQRAERQ